eukprot:6728071-Alexandrium_andersonii.AAC.1
MADRLSQRRRAHLSPATLLPPGARLVGAMPRTLPAHGRGQGWVAHQPARWFLEVVVALAGQTARARVADHE